MKRWRAYTAIVLAGSLNGCSGSPVSPTREPTSPPRPAATARVTGTATVTTVLTTTGGYEYTVEIRLAETGGGSVTLGAVELAPIDAWGPYPPFATFGPEVWNGGNSLEAHGTLTSKPLIATVDVISDWYRPITARIAFSDGTSTASRSIHLTDAGQRPPEPLPDSRFMLSGTVVDGARQALREVTVEVLTGANAGRKTTTDENGTFRLGELKPDTFNVGFSKPDYISDFTSVELTSNLRFSYMLRK